MAADRFHLAWFLGTGFGVGSWGGPWSGSDPTQWAGPRFFTDFARSLERAGFDYVIIEDSSFVCDAYGGDHDVYLRNALTVPKQDPAVLATILTQATTRLGIVPTLTVTEWPPFLLARTIATLDHASGGRAGWNIVTGSSDRAAQNYGHDAQPAHDVRYDMADEFTDLVRRLWTSWDADAVVADPVTGTYVDPAKVHTVDFTGKYFRSRGPLNVSRPPQGTPVLVQAGGSPRGRAFAAGNADTVIAAATTPEQMKAYRDDIRCQAEANGRDPDAIKVLFLLSPTLGLTTAEAQARKAMDDQHGEEHPELALAGLGFITDLDLSGIELDVPVGTLATELRTNGHQSSLEHFFRGSEAKTLREIMRTKHSWEPVGTPEQVATAMEECMEAVGGDGFLLYLENLDRRSIAEVTEGLVPVLQRRGLVRTTYEHKHFKDNLLAF